MKAYEDKDGFQLYIVNILKNFYDEFKRACLGNRFTVRDFEFSRVAVYVRMVYRNHVCDGTLSGLLPLQARKESKRRHHYRP